MLSLPLARMLRTVSALSLLPLLLASAVILGLAVSSAMTTGTDDFAAVSETATGDGPGHVTVLNPESHPLVGGMWAVHMDVGGGGDLAVAAVEGTAFGMDVAFAGLYGPDGTAGQSLQSSVGSDGILYFEDVQEGRWTFEVDVLTAGPHHLQFAMGESVAYASNTASTADVTSNTANGTYPAGAKVDIRIGLTEPVSFDGFEIKDGQKDVQGRNVFDGLDQSFHIATVTIEGRDYALVTGGFRNSVQIIDVTDPVNPTATASIFDGDADSDGNTFDTLGLTIGIAIHSTNDGRHYALVAAAVDDGVQVIDITNPRTPAAVTSVTNGTNGFDALDGLYGITTVAIGDHSYALVASQSSHSVQIINITDPRTPAAVASIFDGDTDSNSYKFDALDGATAITTTVIGGHTYALVASTNYNGVQIIDITNPSTPTAVASISHDERTFPALEGSNGITTTVIGDRHYALVASLSSDGVQIIDITNPFTPTAVASIFDGDTDSDGNTFDALDGAYNVAIHSTNDGTRHYALVTSFDNDGVQIIEITNPLTPAAVVSIFDGDADSDGNTFDVLDDANYVVTKVIGGRPYALVTGYSDDGVQIIDITDPSMPAATGSARQVGTFDEINGANGVAIHSTNDGRTYALVASVNDNGVQIIDITDPIRPTAAASVTDGVDGFDTLKSPNGVATVIIGDRDYALVTSVNDNGVQIIDITDPSNPTPTASVTEGVGGFDELDGSDAIATAAIGGHHYALVAGYVDNGVQIINITDPARPTAASSVSSGMGGFGTLDFAYDIATATIGGHHYALVTSFIFTNFQMINITDPANPTAVASLPRHNGDATEITTTVIGGHHYALFTSSINSKDTIQIFDITDPARPSLTANIVDGAKDGLGGTFNLDDADLIATTAINDRHYALAGKHSGSGAHIIDITDPANPTAVAQISGPLEGLIDFDSLNGIAATHIDGRHYAVTAGYDEYTDGLDTVQMIDITDPDRAFNPHGAFVTLDAGKYTGRAFYKEIEDNAMVFEYTVRSGDASDDLSYAGVGALYLGPNALEDKDDRTDLSPLGLPAPGSAHSLSHNKDIRIDGIIPVVDAGPDLTVSEGHRVTISGTVTDNWDALTYTWSQNPASPAITFVSAASPSASFVAPAVDSDVTLTLTLTVSDGINTGTDSMDITITDTGPAFITTWQTESAGQGITIPGTGNYTIHWGDNTSTNATGSETHTYTDAGNHTVTISGSLEQISLAGDPANAARLVSIDRWGSIGWKSMENAFQGAANMAYNATDNPDLSGVTDMSGMFLDATSFDGGISSWNVSSVTDMSLLFSGASSFDGDISRWDVSSVINMTGMFNDADAFSQNLGRWYVVPEKTSYDNTDASLEVTSIAAQNAFLDGHAPNYGIGTGGDSAMFGMSGSTLAFNAPPAAGYYTVNVTAPGGDFGTGNHRILEIMVTGDRTNADPMLAGIGSKTVNELAPFTFTAEATDADDTDTLTFSLQNAPAGAVITSAGVFTWIPTELQDGTHEVTVMVKDGNGGSDSETVTVTVDEDNAVPALDSIGPKPVDELTQLTFTATASDDDTIDNIPDTLAFSLQGTVPAGATITPHGAFTWRPTELQDGTHDVTVQVTDGSGVTNSEIITITVAEVNQPPALDPIGQKITGILEPLTFDAAASDADFVGGSPTDTLTFSLQGTVPAGATITPQGTFSWTPASGQAGTHTITVRVSDGPGNGIDSENVRVAVTAPDVTSNTANGTYNAGDKVDIRINLTEPVSFDGFEIKDGHNDVQGRNVFDGLDQSFHIATVTIEGRDYALVTGGFRNSVQIIDVTDPVNPTATASIFDGDADSDGNTFDTLGLTIGIAIHSTNDGRHYALVAAAVDDGVQVIDITNPRTPAAVTSVTNGTNGFDALDGLYGITTVAIGDHSYALVASQSSHSVQIINITDPRTPAAVASIFDGDTDSNSYKFDALDGATAITTTVIGGHTYALVASTNYNGVQIIDITNPSTPTAVASISHDERTFPALEGSNGITTTAIDGRHYALVASLSSDGVQIIDITNPLTPGAVASIFDGDTDSDGNTFDALDGAYNVAIHSTNDGTRHYALVTSFDNDGVQIIEITNPLTPAAVVSIFDGDADSDGNTFDVLDDANYVVTKVIGGRPYALVTGYSDDGVQIIDITDPSLPTAAGSARQVGTFDELAGPRATTTIMIDGRHYALVVSRIDDGVQIIDITDPVRPTATASVTDGVGGFNTLENTVAGYGIATAVIDGRHYALVPSYTDDGVQIIEITDPRKPVATASVIDGTNGFDRLEGAYDVATITIGGYHYALVAGFVDAGVQIINITDPARPTAVASVTDNVNGFNALTNVYYIATTTIGEYHYALVTSETEGVQIINITNPASPTAVTSLNFGVSGHVSAQTVITTVIGGHHYALIEVANNNKFNIYITNITNPAVPSFAAVIVEGNKDSLGGTFDLADAITFTTVVISDRHYVLVGRGGNDNRIIPVIDITNPANPIAVVPVVADRDGFARFISLHGIAATHIDGRHYTLVADTDAYTVQMIDITDPDRAFNPHRAFVTLDAGDYTGRAFFKEIEGNAMVFEYTVRSGDASDDLSYAGIGALHLGPNALEDQDGFVDLSPLDLPAPGSARSLSHNKDIRIDGIIPVVDAGPDLTVSEGHRVTISGTATDNWDALTYTWSQNPASPAIAFVSAASPSASFVAPAVDSDVTLALTLTVSDGINTGTDSMNITITDTGPAFITTWQTESAGQGITIPGTGNYTIHWGDNTSTNATGSETHTYTDTGNHTVTILGSLEQISLAGDPANAARLISIDRWGSIGWKSMENAFQGAANMAYNATDNPDLSGVTDMSGMFLDATSFDGGISSWNVSSVTDMSLLFSGASSFDGDISRWDVSSVTNMTGTFRGAASFDRPIGSWNVSSATYMSGMFDGAGAFLQNLGRWYVVPEKISYGNAGTSFTVTSIAAQNAFLDRHAPNYGIGSGGDSALFNMTGNNLTFKAVPTVGIYSVNVTAPGGDFGTGNHRIFEIMVTGDRTNTDPMLADIGSKTVDELAPLTFTAIATDADDTDTLTFSLQDAPAGAVITPAGVFTWTPTEMQDGTHDVIVLVSDGNGGSDSETVTVTVGELNAVPMLDRIGQKPVDELTQLTFTATASDDDTIDNIPDTLAFSLQGTVPAGAAITPAGVFTWTPTERQDGIYNVTVQVADGSGVTDSEIITITVAEVNQPPALDPIGQKSAVVLVQLTFDATASDMDIIGGVPDTLTFSLQNAPAGAAITSSGAFTWTPTGLQTGNHTVTVRVSDAADVVNSKAVIITVRNTTAGDNTPPVIETASGVQTLAGGTHSYRVDTGFAGSLLDAVSCHDVADGTITPTFTGQVDRNAIGMYDIVYLCVDMAANGAVPLTVTWDVGAPDPVIVLTGPETADIVQDTLYEDPGATCSDHKDGTIQVTVSGTVDTSQSGATYLITYTCTDSDGNIATVLRSVTVVPDTGIITDEAPRFVSASYDFSTGTLIVTFSESIGNGTDPDYSRLHMRGFGLSAGGITLSDADLRSHTDDTVSVTLNPAQRVMFAALAVPQQLDIDALAVTDADSHSNAREHDRPISIQNRPTQAPVTITEPAGDHVTQSASLTMRGTSAENTPVTVRINGLDVQTVISDSAGNWSAAVTLAEGPNALVATDGTSTSGTVTITLDTQPPAVQSVTYGTSSGTLSITFDEAIVGTGNSTDPDYTKIHIRSSESSTGGITLSEVDLRSHFGRTVTATLDGEQRETYLNLISPRQLDIDAGAVADALGHGTAGQQDIEIIEISRSSRNTGGPGPAIDLGTLRGLNLQAALPDCITEAIKSLDDRTGPILPVAQDDGNTCDFPLAINGYGYMLEGTLNTLVPYTVTTNRTVEITFTVYSKKEIAHFGLYMNLQGSQTEYWRSDTHVAYDRGETVIVVVDPHGYVADAAITIQADPGHPEKRHVTVTVEFGVPMGPTNMVAYLWDTDRRSTVLQMVDTLDVTAAAVPEPGVLPADPEPTVPKSELPADPEPTVPKSELPADPEPAAPVILWPDDDDDDTYVLHLVRMWSGFEPELITDAQLIDLLGLEDYQDVDLPDWMMTQLGVLVANGDVTVGEFMLALQYVLTHA